MAWLITLVILVGSFVVGSYFAKSMRMADYGWKIGLILSTILMAGYVTYEAIAPASPITYIVQENDTLASIADRFGIGVKTLADENGILDVNALTSGSQLTVPQPKPLRIKQGIDLSGGVILIYEVDEERSRRAQSAGAADRPDQADSAAENAEDGDDEVVDIAALVEALTRRINPGGVKEVVIRPYGERQVEIIIPEVNDAEIRQIKQMIVKSGFLKFLILAKRDDHARLVELAEAQGDVRQVKDGSQIVGEWVRVARMDDGKDFKVDFEPNNVIRELRPGQLEALMAVDPFGVEGRHLYSVRPSFDETLNPSVDFSMTGRGASLFQGLTSSNLPETGRSPSRLGIIMDNELISAPTIQSTISDRGTITGRFTQEDVDFLVNVLRAGKLPAVLQPEPISESKISPLLGSDTIRKGKFAIGASLIAVILFMIAYYRFAGFVACFALLANLLLILALMILIGAAFTLPGLAGLVLTVGMSVDANVLIYERIREELRRGAALRMAIRNGFGRATTTIVDAQLTTLITAVVMYAIGTDQIRGFAVALILGILMCMYTAIFCSRVIFDIAERQRWITKLNMAHVLSDPHYDWIGKRGIAAVFSACLMILSLVAVVARGKQIFDIDFLGGTSVQAMLHEPMPIEQVRQRLDGLADDVSLTQVNPEGQAPDTVYKIDTSLQEREELEQKLAERFRDDRGRSLFVSHSMAYTTPKVVVMPDAGTSSGASDVEAPSQGSEDDAPTDAPRTPADDVQAETTGTEIPLIQSVDPEGSAPSPAESGDVGSDANQRADDPGAAAAEGQSDVDTTGAERNESDPRQATPHPPLPTGARTDLPPDTVFALGVPSRRLVAQAPPDSVRDASADGSASASAAGDKTADVNSTDASATDELATDEAPETRDSEDQSDATASVPRPRSMTESQLRFDERITKDTLLESFRQAALKLGISEPITELTGPAGQTDSAAGFDQWNLRTTATPQELTSLLEEMKTDLESRPAWLSSSKIGSSVAGDTTRMALAAIMASLVFLVGYIWLRFQHLVFGLAAVIALVHDVVITVGAIAASLWLSHVFGFFLIEEFKISLPVVAALLTIIGYSLNDTIVVFDRIREVRGKSPAITEEMINTSVNQTMSRTILTALTTLLVVVVLYAFGGEGIHGFAFALLIGVVVGTYSSVFVASAALLWMGRTTGKRSTTRKKVAA